MGRPSRYSPEVRERAVRMVFEHQAEHESQWAAMASIASKIGCTAETLRKWVRQAERDTGRRAGLTTDEKQRLKELERENRELKGWSCWPEAVMAEGRRDGNRGAGESEASDAVEGGTSSDRGGDLPGGSLGGAGGAASRGKRESGVQLAAAVSGGEAGSRLGVVGAAARAGDGGGRKSGAEADGATCCT